MMSWLFHHLLSKKLKTSSLSCMPKIAQLQDGQETRADICGRTSRELAMAIISILVVLTNKVTVDSPMKSFHSTGMILRQTHWERVTQLIFKWCQISDAVLRQRLRPWVTKETCKSPINKPSQPVVVEVMVGLEVLSQQVTALLKNQKLTTTIKEEKQLLQLIAKSIKPLFHGLILAWVVNFKTLWIALTLLLQSRKWTGSLTISEHTLSLKLEWVPSSWRKQHTTRPLLTPSRKPILMLHSLLKQVDGASLHLLVSTHKVQNKTASRRAMPSKKVKDIHWVPLCQPAKQFTSSFKHGLLMLRKSEDSLFQLAAWRLPQLLKLLRIHWTEEDRWLLQWNTSLQKWRVILLTISTATILSKRINLRAAMILRQDHRLALLSEELMTTLISYYTIRIVELDLKQTSVFGVITTTEDFLTIAGSLAGMPRPTTVNQAEAILTAPMYQRPSNHQWSGLLDGMTEEVEADMTAPCGYQFVLVAMLLLVELAFINPIGKANQIQEQLTLDSSNASISSTPSQWLGLIESCTGLIEDLVLRLMPEFGHSGSKDSSCLLKLETMNLDNHSMILILNGCEHLSHQSWWFLISYLILY